MTLCASNTIEQVVRQASMGLLGFEPRLLGYEPNVLPNSTIGPSYGHEGIRILDFRFRRPAFCPS